MISAIKSHLNKFHFYRYLAHKRHKYNVSRNPKAEANRVYKIYFKKKINWDTPKNLIEKIYWLQFNTDTKLWTKYADKYIVREYVSNSGYKNNLPMLYGKWNNADEIDFTKLPAKFVLKTNNGCGTVLVVKDKSKLNLNKVRKKLNRWLNISYGYRSAQFHYTKIVPCIIAEELLLQDEKDQMISPNSLIDYKIYCINGEPQTIWVSYDRTQNGVAMTMYDVNWKKTPQHLISSDFYKYNQMDISKPLCLDQMLEMSRKLSKPFNQVRIDFYVINNKPYFGEMTFTTGWGFFTYDFYDYLGSKIDLSKENKIT